METSHNYIRFEVLSKDEDTIVLKRVISSKKRKPKEKEKIEMSLPKLSVHYFDIEKLEYLQSIATNLNNETLKKEAKKNFIYRLFDFFKILRYSIR